jgi:hypothetical protein
MQIPTTPDVEGGLCAVGPVIAPATQRAARGEGGGDLREAHRLLRQIEQQRRGASQVVQALVGQKGEGGGGGVQRAARVKHAVGVCGDGAGARGGAGGGVDRLSQRAGGGKHAVGICDDGAGARGWRDAGAGEAGGVKNEATNINLDDAPNNNLQSWPRPKRHIALPTPLHTTVPTRSSSSSSSSSRDIVSHEQDIGTKVQDKLILGSGISRCEFQCGWVVALVSCIACVGRVRTLVKKAGTYSRSATGKLDQHQRQPANSGISRILWQCNHPAAPWACQASCSPSLWQSLSKYQGR